VVEITPGEAPMCVTLLGQVVAVDAAGALVAAEGIQLRAGARLFPDVAVGEWVLVGAGTILQRLTDDDARLMANPTAYEPRGATDAHP
jgi:hydrogenase maturation factor